MQASRAPSRAGDLGPAVPLLAATAWSIGALGGSRPVDMAIATTLVCLAFALSGSCARGGALLLLRTPLGLGFLGVIGWTSAVGLAASGPGLTALKLPWLLVTLAVAAAAARRLTQQHRLQVTTGLVTIGVALAVAAVLEWVRLAWAGEALPIRAATLLGYPNGAGVLLVATALTTVSLHRLGRINTVALLALVGVQALGVLATGSRLALLATVACIAVMACTRRSRAAVGVAAAAAAPFIAVLVQRFAASRPERIDLWRAALAEIRAHPIVGRGPAPELVLSPLAAGKPTTHAHNEFLQLAVEYGLVGLALTLLVLVLSVLAQRHLDDPWLAAGAVTMGTLAFTDFALRIPGVSIVLALLGAMAWSGANGGSGLVTPVSSAVTPEPVAYYIQRFWPPERSRYVGRNDHAADHNPKEDAMTSASRAPSWGATTRPPKRDDDRP